MWSSDAPGAATIVPVRCGKNEVRNTVKVDTLSGTEPTAPMRPAFSSDERERLAALRGYDILDTDPELAFDDIALLAAHICKAPIALVSFVDEDRQWFKSRVGIDSEQTARDISFCTHTIRRPDELFVVPDALADPRFSGSPLVAAGPRIRFYAGAPLVAPDGHALGALCVKDIVPRDLDATQQQALKALSRQVVTLLELRRSMQERRLLDERHHLVLESVANAIVMVDAEDRIALVNAQAETMFGYSRSELIGEPIDRLVPRRLRARRAAQRLALRSGDAAASSSVDSFGLRKDGTEIATEIGLTHLVTGATAFVLESVSDVSHRKRIEARLNEVQTLHRAIVDNAGCAIISTAPDGTITSFNPAARRMFGYAAEEVVGLRRPDFILDPGEQSPNALPPSANQTFAPGFDISVECECDGRPSECEWTCIRKDGRRLPVLLSVTALRDAAGLSTGFLGLAIDISERKRIEDLLRAKNEDLKTFAYTVSHDLKAPLRGISGYAQELERRHQEGLGERARFCITQIITASRNLDQLIEDLLNYSRFISERPQSDEVRLFELIERILRDRSLVLGEQEVQVDVQVPRLVLRTWERGLHQVLSNLIDNALKYSRNATPARLGIRAEIVDAGCRISVADNGIGFDMKYHDRIFGLFNRLVRTSEFEGTGAGLAIVAKLMDKLGGTVRAESSPGEGATFLIELPHLQPETSSVHR